MNVEECRFILLARRFVCFEPGADEKRRFARATLHNEATQDNALALSV